MIDRVLVPMDGSEMSEHALEFTLAAHPEAEITVLHVVGGPSPHMAEATGLALAEDLAVAAQEKAQPVFDTVAAITEEHDADVDTLVALGLPARAIVERAGEYDLVVIGAHGRGLGARLLLGNVAETVTKRSPTPVTIVR